MKYTIEVDINQPIDKVVSLFNDADNLKKWMDGLESYEHLSGTPGKEGAQARMVFQMGQRRIEMTETVLKNNLPEEYSGSYETKGVYNLQHNHFQPLVDNKTKYIAENEFKFSGWMKLMGFASGPFKKQTLKYMNAFKEFAESK